MPSDRRPAPLVSIGVPVFEEEEGLPAVLDSLLAQDYEPLQIVVCDNASTDATVRIAEDYAARDPRIEVHRSEQNRGAAFNFNRCFGLARGEYFTWASGHDTRLPAAVGRCVEALEADPGLVVAYPRSLLRRLDGSLVPVTDDTLETRGLAPLERLRKTIFELITCNIVHGVIRASALERTRLFRRCLGSDQVLLAELSLLGEFHQLDEALFVRTENRAPQGSGEWHRRTLAMLGAGAGPARRLPYTVMGIEHVAGVWHVSPGAERLGRAVRCAAWYAYRSKRRLWLEWHPRRAGQAVVAGVRWAPRRLMKLRARET